jgi:hypothetical protein
VEPIPPYLTTCLIIEQLVRTEAYANIRGEYLQLGRFPVRERVLESVEIMVDRRIISDFKSFELWLNDGALYVSFHYKSGNSHLEGWKEFCINTECLKADKAPEVLAMIRVMGS